MAGTMRMHGRRRWAPLLLCLVAAAPGIEAQVREKEPGRFPEAIEDNSFFIEEAYNQEVGVIQHISNAMYSTSPERELLYSFTEEWPIGGRLHQASVTIPVSLLSREHAGQVGDVLLNYRLQLFDDDAWSNVAPRLSVILPTGRVSSGMGSGVLGLQINLPASKRLSDAFVVHANAGVTMLPGARRILDDGTEARHSTTAYNLGASIIWLAGPDVNLLLESVTNVAPAFRDDGSTFPSAQTIVSPGIRFAINLGTLQIVPGVGVPVTFDGGRAFGGLFLYLSFEHPW